MSSLLAFLEFFIVYLIVAAFVIIGFYVITRGERILQPDGSIKRQGKIFMDWSLYWEQTIGTTKVYYTGDTLRDKLRWLKDCNTALGARLQLAGGGVSLQYSGALSGTELIYIADLLNCRVTADEDSRLLLYTEEPNYYFPAWLRFPLSQCPPCMASIYGSLLYWALMWICPNMMSWAEHTTGAYLFFWIVFCLALSSLNKLVHKIIG